MSSGISSERLLQLFEIFLNERASLPFEDWGVIDVRQYRVELTQSTLHPYFGQAHDYLSEVVNSYNEFALRIIDLAAWRTVLDALDDEDEAMEVVHEFLGTLTFFCINQPYALKNRFEFLSCHLCAIASQFLPDKEKIFFNEQQHFNRHDMIKRFVPQWEHFKALICVLSIVDGREFRTALGNARDRLHHRSRREVGFFYRTRMRMGQKSDLWSWAIDEENPLPLTKLLDASIAQRALLHKAMIEFRNLALQQSDALQAFIDSFSTREPS